MSRRSLAIICAICVPALGGSAAAAAPTLTISTGTDPAESITTQLIASGGSTSKYTALSGTVKPTGGQGCAANASADSGQSLFFGGDLEEGPFSQSVNHTFESAGSYLLCAWLNDGNQSGNPVVASASLTFAVRAPHLALSIAAPATVRPGQVFQIVTTAQAEVARRASEYVLPNTGRGCPANAAAGGQASGERSVYWAAHGSEWSVEGGPFSESVNETLAAAGQYLVCAYMQYPTSESPPEASASAIVTAILPVPPCIVPHIRPGSTLASVERRVHGSHCSVGRVRANRSRRYKRGRVLRLGARAGRVLPFHTALEIIVSAGQR
jgi:hypothetical protein